MNIVTRTAGGAVIFRPDTTLKRSSDDFYVPDFVDALTWTPVCFIQMSRAGKCIAGKFAERYYELVNFGMLLYPENFIDGSEEGFARACCLDHTSFLPSPLRPKAELEGNGLFFTASKDGIPLGEAAFGGAESAQSLLESVSKYCYLRVGDIVAAELQERKPLCTREEARCRISASCNGSEILDFNIIF